MTAKKPSGYTWNGVWDAGAGGWQEFFGNADGEGLPPRDLTAEDVAGFSDAQLACLTSPAGKRLYEPITDGDAKQPAKSDKPSGADKPGDQMPDGRV